MKKSTRLNAMERLRVLRAEEEDIGKQLLRVRREILAAEKGKEIEPDIRLDVNLVPHGYQIDGYANGQLVFSSCRDFGGSYPVAKLRKNLVGKLLGAFQEWAKDK